MFKPHHSKKAVRMMSYTLIVLVAFIFLVMLMRAYQEAAYLDEAAKGYPNLFP